MLLTWTINFKFIHVVVQKNSWVKKNNFSPEEAVKVGISEEISTAPRLVHS